MLTKEAQKQLWDSDFSDMYMFPESQMGQRVRGAEKQGAKFSCRRSMGRRQSGDRCDLRRDGKDHDTEVTARSAVIPSKARIFLPREAPSSRTK